MLVKEITRLIEDFAPLQLQEEYDNAGLICGSPEDEVRSVLLTTDVTEEVVEEAIAGGHNLIISHHPLTLKGLKHLRPENYINRCLITAIRHRICIYSAHTNMDAVISGVSGRMADRLGLVNREVLEKKGKLYSLCFYTPQAEAGRVRSAILACGAGHIGRYSHCSYNVDGEGTFQAEEGARPFVGSIGELHTEKEVRTEITVPDYLLQECISTLKSVHPYEEPVWNIVCLDNLNPVCGFGLIGELPKAEESYAFLQRVKETFHCGVVRHTPICRPAVRKVALCGGSGAFLIRTAMARQADIYISGDFKYHEFFQAENKLILADIGHYESEQFTKDIFYELLTKKISKFAVQFSRAVTNPVSCL